MEENIGSAQLLKDATATGYGKAIQIDDVARTYQVMGLTTGGAGAATVVVQVSNKNHPDVATDLDWMTLGTVTLTLSTTQTSDGFASNASWRYTRCKVTAISGTGATLQAWMGA